MSNDPSKLIAAIKAGAGEIPPDIAAQARSIDLTGQKTTDALLRINVDLSSALYLAKVGGDALLIFEDGSLLRLENAEEAIRSNESLALAFSDFPDAPLSAFMEAETIEDLLAMLLDAIGTAAGSTDSESVAQSEAVPLAQQSPNAGGTNDERRAALGALEAEDGVLENTERTSIDGSADALISFDAPFGTATSNETQVPESDGSAPDVQRTEIVLSDGRDRFNGRQSEEPLDISAGAGNDRVRGSNGNDKIDGGSGKDRLWGGGGDDVLIGGAGNDRLSGGAGSDRLEGGAGRDRLSGGAGDDTFVLSGAQDARDVVQGGAGHDRIDAGDDGLVMRRFDAGKSSIEEIDANGGNISGTDGRDVLDFTGATLRDVSSIDGGAGNDRITGSDGDNHIVGGAGRDRLIGGAGDDVLDGGAGRDRLEGGEGADTYILKQDGGVDRIIGFDSNSGDQLDVSQLVPAESADDLSGYLRLSEDSRGNTRVQLNTDGDGDEGNFVDVAILEGVSGLSLNDIVDDQDPST